MPLLFSSFAVLVCLVYVHLPFMVLPLYANLEKHDQALLDAAQDLGANAWQRFWRITFPLSLPGVYAGAALVFIPALGIFAIPDILGGPDDSLIGNVIKQQFLETRDWPFGSVLSIVLTVAALALAGLAAWVGRARRRGGRPVRRRSLVAVGAALAGYAFLYLPLVDRRRLLVQRLAAQRRVGRLHARLVPQARRQRRDADRRRQFAADRAGREPRVDGAGHDGGRRDAPLPAAAAAGPGADADRDPRDPDGRRRC